MTDCRHAQYAEYTGTLLHHAEARTALLDGKAPAVPMLCMDVALDTPLHNTLHVEQPFPVDHQHQCQAAAHRLKTGMRVTVMVPLADIRLVGRATHIHLIKSPQEQTTHA